MRFRINKSAVALSFITALLAATAAFALAGNDPQRGGTDGATVPADPSSDLAVPGDGDAEHAETVPADPDADLLIPSDDGGAAPATPPDPNAAPNHIEAMIPQTILDGCKQRVKDAEGEEQLPCRAMLAVAAGEMAPGDYSDAELADAVSAAEAEE